MERDERLGRLENIEKKIETLLIDMSMVKMHIISELGGNGTEGNIRRHIEDIRKSIKELKELLLSQNGRIESLEHWRWYIIGCISVLSIIVVSILIPISLNYLQR